MAKLYHRNYKQPMLSDVSIVRRTPEIFRSGERLAISGERVTQVLRSFQGARQESLPVLA